MADGRFSLEAVERMRELEQERIEKDLARISSDRGRERALCDEMKERRAETIGAFSPEGPDAGAGLHIAFYAWRDFADSGIARQSEVAEGLDAQFRERLAAYRKARIEREKIRILRDRWTGERKIREKRREESVLEAWIAARTRPELPK